MGLNAFYECSCSVRGKGSLIFIVPDLAHAIHTVYT